MRQIGAIKSLTHAQHMVSQVPLLAENNAAQPRERKDAEYQVYGCPGAILAGDTGDPLALDSLLGSLEVPRYSCASGLLPHRNRQATESPPRASTVSFPWSS